MTAIALGTAQFGLPYGIANTVGQVDESAARGILRFAADQGIHALDTAITYGTSEQVLGRIGMADWQIVTKLPGIPDGIVDVAAWVQQQVEDSFKRLGVTGVDGLLLHRPEQLLGHSGAALYAALCEQRESGRVKRVGISIYDPIELDALMPKFHFDIVQVPLNMLDARLPRSGWMQRLRDKGAALHVRSVFLQGLLLMGRDKRPASFARWQHLWDDWERWLAANDITPLQACLRYALTLPDIEQVILGVDSVTQLQQILAAAGGLLPGGYETFQTEDELLLNPALWVSN